MDVEDAQFVQRSTGVTAAAEVVGGIHQRTEGVVADASVVDALSVPDTLRALVQRRMEPISVDCRPVFTRAAIIGRTFPQALLTSAAIDRKGALDEGLVARAVAEAVAAGLTTADQEPDTEQSDLEPRRRFATDPAPVTRHTSSSGSRLTSRV